MPFKNVKVQNVDGEKNEFFILEIIRFYLEVKNRVSGYSHAIRHAGFKLRTVRSTYSGNAQV